LERDREDNQLFSRTGIKKVATKGGKRDKLQMAKAMRIKGKRGKFREKKIKPLFLRRNQRIKKMRKR